MATLTGLSFAGWKSWTAPRVDPELVGEWVEEFEREDGYRLDLAFLGDGSCSIGDHGEETLSSFVMANFPNGYVMPDGVLLACQYSWGTRGERLLLIKNVKPQNGPLWAQLRARILLLIKSNDIETTGAQIYEIVERSQSRLHIKQVSGSGPYPQELKLVRWGSERSVES